MIPFHRPFTAPRQQEYLLDSLASGYLQGDGPYTRRVLQRLRALYGIEQALLTPSASHALELAFWQLQPGDEVILPAYNFPSAASAVLRGGGVPVFCDVDPETQNADPAQAAACITARTRAICLTHYAGVACDMDAFLALAEQHGLLLVEDAAHALGSLYRGQPLGTIGDCGCYSFHQTKNITCGEGGAYLHRDAPAHFEQIRIYRDKGTNRHAFLQGAAAYYSWEEMGSSHLLSDLHAALLLAQLEQVQHVNSRRQTICTAYHQRLQPAFAAGALQPMGMPAYAQANGHLYYIRCGTRVQRLRLQTALAGQGIETRPHFVPLHLGGMGQRLGYHRGDFPHSEQTADTLLRLPLFYDLTEREVEQVCHAVLEAVL